MRARCLSACHPSSIVLWRACIPSAALPLVLFLYCPLPLLANLSSLSSWPYHTNLTPPLPLAFPPSLSSLSSSSPPTHTDTPTLPLTPTSIPSQDGNSSNSKAPASPAASGKTCTTASGASSTLAPTPTPPTTSTGNPRPPMLTRPLSPVYKPPVPASSWPSWRFASNSSSPSVGTARAPRRCNGRVPSSVPPVPQLTWPSPSLPSWSGSPSPKLPSTSCARRTAAMSPPSEGMPSK